MFLFLKNTLMIKMFVETCTIYKFSILFCDNIKFINWAQILYFTFLIRPIMSTPFANRF